MYCINCAKATKNPKFCSKSCAATMNNKLYPKRVKHIKHCISCNTEIPTHKSYCKPCFANKFLVDWSKVTKGEVVGKRKYQKHSRIRGLSLKAKKILGNTCRACGYSKHVEIAHRKSINSFPDTTPISVINDITNLIPLCPNCHWEFDSGLLSVP